MGLGGWLKDRANDVGDAVQGGFKAGEKVVGEGVEKVSHAAESGLDDVGLHGAADWVRSHGDSLADHLGAEVGEMQLGQTDDPKQLIHGDVGKLHEDVENLNKLATAFGEVAGGLGKIKPGEWRGLAGDAYDNAASTLPKKWSTAEDACSSASKALSSFASTVEWAQGQAADAIQKWKDAEAKQKKAEDDYNTSVETYNKAVDANNAGGTDPLPAKPGDFVDPGPALFQAAEDTLQAARKQRNSAAQDAAATLKAATATAPAKPEFTDRMVADAEDGLSLYGYQGAHFFGGIMKGTAELGKFARGLNPLDPYNITHPAEFLSSQNQMAAGLLDAAVHPGALVHSIVGSGWTTDPAEALGKLVPQIALTVATDGAGAAEGIAERGAVGVGEDVAERSAMGLGEDAAERGATGLGEDAAGVGEDAGSAAQHAEHNPAETVQKGHDESSTCGGREPVNFATGAFYTEHTDLHLPGVVPLEVSRKHSSDWHYGLWFGPTWVSTFDERVDINDDHVVIIRADATAVAYPHPTVEEPSQPYLGRAPRLRRTEVGGYELTDPDTGEVRHYLRPDGGRSYLTAVTDPTGHRVTILRDSHGVPVELRHTGGYRVLVATVGDRVSGLTVVKDDGATPVRVAEYQYDAVGHLVGVVNASGRPLRYKYDDAGRLIEWADRNGTQYWNIYDDQGRCVEQGGTAGVMAGRFAYNRLADALRETLVIDSAGNISRYLINERFQVISETDPLGNETRSTWDDRNRLIARTDPLGRTTKLDYDADGNLTRITRPDGTYRSINYAVVGGQARPTSIRMPDETVWRYTYDENGNRTSITDPMGATTILAYDERGHLVSVTDALGAVQEIENTPAGLPVQVTDPDGTTTRFERDALGRVTATVDQLGQRTELVWTADSQLARRTLPDGSVEEWAYDGEGNPVTYKDAAGRVTTTRFTHFDLPAAVTTPDGSTTTYTYDPELRLTQVANPSGATWRYEYDAAGRLRSETDYNGRTLSYEYDRAGQLMRTTNGAEQSVHYTYDALGSMVSRTTTARDVSDSSIATTLKYDPLGRLLHAQSPGVALRLERDAMGRVIAETVNGRKISTTYDVLGRRQQRTTPARVETQWAYGTGRSPSSMIVAGQSITFEHDLAGRETGRRVGAMVLEQTWDQLGQPTVQRILRAGSEASTSMADRLAGLGGTTTGPEVLQERGYTYEGPGRLIGVSDKLNGARRFELDIADRITAVTSSGESSEMYTYDPVGNITRAQRGAQTAERRDYDGNLLRRSGRSRYAYDAQGRLIRHTKVRISQKPATWHYEWDANDRLTSVKTPDGVRWTYLYDALGRRVAKQRHNESGEIVDEVYFVWDGMTLVEQVDANRTAVSWTFHEKDPVAQVELSQDEVDARFYAIVTDLAGNPSELVSAQGNITSTGQRTIWGAPPEPGTSPTPFGFRGSTPMTRPGCTTTFTATTTRPPGATSPRTRSDSLRRRTPTTTSTTPRLGQTRRASLGRSA